MRNSILLPLFALTLCLGCNKADTASASAVPGEADASAQGDDASAQVVSGEDSSEAYAAEDDISASVDVEGEGSEASADVSEPSEE